MRAVLPFFAFGVLGALGLSACRPATTAAI
jgi:hypothetical protein